MKVASIRSQAISLTIATCALVSCSDCAANHNTSPAPSPPMVTIKHKKTSGTRSVRQIESTSSQGRRCPADMVYVAGGQTRSFFAEQSAKISITPTCIERTEVTVKQYEACVEAGVCSVPLSNSAKDGGQCNWKRKDRVSHPINCLSRKMATQYCSWRGWRLPTELEWWWGSKWKGNELRVSVGGRETR